MAHVFERVSSIPTRLQEQDIEQLRQYSDEMATMFGWFNDAG
jgi:hypothetical protein